MGNNNNMSAVQFAIAAILVVLLVLSSFSSPSITTMAQQITAPPPPPTSSITTGQTMSPIITPPLTPEEQEQQNRLQNVIAATTANLNETEKQVSGVVFTPRWSDVVWVNPNSISVLVAYCLPGEFADSGQEILGGFELEVLESYAVALPQGFMAWMAIVGNEDEQNRLPAAVGVICASDLNQADTRILSPQEQQEINNVIQQFTTIQNTQITNIEQVINVINDVTTPPQNETGGGMTPPPPTNDTGITTEEQPLTVEAFANVTEAYGPATIMFDANVTGGTPPYSYIWSGFGSEILEKSFTQFFDQPSCEPPSTYCNEPFIFEIKVADSKGQTASDYVGINITIEPLTVEIIPNATSGFTLDRFELKSNVGGGTPPYTYSWIFSGDFQNFAAACNTLEDPTAAPDNSCFVFDTSLPGEHQVVLGVDDSKGRGSVDEILITVEPRPPGGLLPGIPLPSNDTGEVISPPPPEGGGEEGESGPQGGVTEEDQPTEEPDEGGGDTGGELPPEESTEEPVG